MASVGKTGDGVQYAQLAEPAATDAPQQSNTAAKADKQPVDSATLVEGTVDWLAVYSQAPQLAYPDKSAFDPFKGAFEKLPKNPALPQVQDPKWELKGDTSYLGTSPTIRTETNVTGEEKLNGGSLKTGQHYISVDYAKLPKTSAPPADADGKYPAERSIAGDVEYRPNATGFGAKASVRQGLAPASQEVGSGNAGLTFNQADGAYGLWGLADFNRVHGAGGTAASGGLTVNLKNRNPFDKSPIKPEVTGTVSGFTAPEHSGDTLKGEAKVTIDLPNGDKVDVGASLANNREQLLSGVTVPPPVAGTPGAAPAQPDLSGKTNTTVFDGKVGFEPKDQGEGPVVVERVEGTVNRTNNNRNSSAGSTNFGVSVRGKVRDTLPTFTFSGNRFVPDQGAAGWSAQVGVKIPFPAPTPGPLDPPSSEPALKPAAKDAAPSRGGKAPAPKKK